MTSIKRKLIGCQMYFVFAWTLWLSPVTFSLVIKTALRRCVKALKAKALSARSTSSSGEGAGQRAHCALDGVPLIASVYARFKCRVLDNVNLILHRGNI